MEIGTFGHEPTMTTRQPPRLMQQHLRNGQVFLAVTCRAKAPRFNPECFLSNQESGDRKKP